MKKEDNSYFRDNFLYLVLNLLTADFEGVRPEDPDNISSFSISKEVSVLIKLNHFAVVLNGRVLEPLDEYYTLGFRTRNGKRILLTIPPQKIYSILVFNRSKEKTLRLPYAKPFFGSIIPKGDLKWIEKLCEEAKVGRILDEQILVQGLYGTEKYTGKVRQWGKRGIFYEIKEPKKYCLGYFRKEIIEDIGGYFHEAYYRATIDVVGGVCERYFPLEENIEVMFKKGKRWL